MASLLAEEHQGCDAGEVSVFLVEYPSVDARWSAGLEGQLDTEGCGGKSTYGAYSWSPVSD